MGPTLSHTRSHIASERASERDFNDEWPREKSNENEMMATKHGRNVFNSVFKLASKWKRK